MIAEGAAHRLPFSMSLVFFLSDFYTDKYSFNKNIELAIRLQGLTLLNREGCCELEKVVTVELQNYMPPDQKAEDDLVPDLSDTLLEQSPSYVPGRAEGEGPLRYFSRFFSTAGK